jgi:hypothetical protein
VTDNTRRAPVAARVLLVSFVAVAIGTIVWGFWVVSGVREKARDTDAALRALAWAALCYRSASGAWPDTDESMRTTGEGWLCAERSARVEGTPATREAALAGLTPPASFDAALVLARLTLPPASPGNPRVDARGNPSGIGTLAEVNGWLAAAGAPATTSQAPTQDETHP